MTGYPRLEMVRSHLYTCANVQVGSTFADKCDCGALDSAGKAIPVTVVSPAAAPASAVYTGPTIRDIEAADTIDALVSALKPFAEMPMPDYHGVYRERILKARAALALSRGERSSAIGIDAIVRSAVLEGMTDEELRRAWNLAVLASDHRRIQEVDSEIERRGKPCGIASPSSRDCPSMKEVGGGMEGERYRCAVCGKGYYLDYEEMK